MSSTFQKNDYVRYASNGICKIDSVTQIESPVNRKMAEYYVLKPVSNPESTFYIPTDTDGVDSKLSRVLSKDQLDELIMSSGETKTEWITDRKARAERFSHILSGCNQEDLLNLASCIHQRKQELADSGKKLTSTDEGILRRAEKLIQSDFSFVLGISEEEVGEYIRKLLEPDSDD